MEARAPGWLRGMDGLITAHCSSESQNSSAIAVLIVPLATGDGRYIAIMGA